MDEGYVVVQASVWGSWVKGWLWYWVGWGVSKFVGILDYLACVVYVWYELYFFKIFVYG